MDTVRTIYVLKKRDRDITTDLGFNYHHISALRALRRETNKAVEALGGDPTKDILAVGEEPTEPGIYATYINPKSRNFTEIREAIGGYILSGFTFRTKLSFTLQKLEELVNSQPRREVPERLADSFIIKNYADEEDDESLLVPPTPLGADANVQEQLCNELLMVAYRRRMKLRSMSV